MSQRSFRPVIVAGLLFLPMLVPAQALAAPELSLKRVMLSSGGVGYFAPDGSVDSCIVLRTAVVKDGVMHVQSGAGIVADSNPEYEQRECEAKASALIAAAREAVRVASEPGFGQ